MTDLSGIPDDQLLGMLNQQSGSPLAGMSDADLMKALGQQPAERSSGVGDFFKSIPGGALSSIGNMLSASGQAASAEMAQPMDIPTPQEAKSALEENVIGKTYDPQGRPGQFGARIGEFLANPTSYFGPGGILAKGAITVGSAVGSEAGRQAFEGTKGEVPASLAGAILGGAGTGAAAARATAARAVIPTADELRGAARAAYRSPEVTTLEIAPDAVRNLSTRIENDLVTQGFRPRNAPGAFEEARGLTPGQGVNSVRVADLDAARKALQRDAAELNPAGRPTEAATAARVTINHIDDYLANIAPTDVLAGDAAAAQRVLAEARANWGAAARSSLVDRKIAKAELQADATHSGMNVGNKIRQTMVNVVDNPNLHRGYVPEELAQARRIVGGTTTNNLLRFSGNLLGGGGGLGMLSAGGAGALAAGPAGAALPVVGFGLKRLQNASTLRQAAILDEMLRSRSPLAQQIQALQALAASGRAAPVGATQGGLLGALGGASSGILPF